MSFASTNTDSWLASIDSNRYITEIGFVQTHNSEAFKSYNGVGKFTLNQEGASLTDQFNGGVRGFSLKTSTESVADRTTFRFEHGGNQVGDEDSDQSFRALFRSLAYHPSEFVMFDIGPYSYSKFLKSNGDVKFWETSAGKRIHSFFFTDGAALNGTPRLWNDEIFSQWVPDLPEAYRSQLRGQPLFYIPKYDSPTIPKVGELRGKFVLTTDSWTGGRSYTYDELLKIDPEYAKDFPNGITWNNPGNRVDANSDRMDTWDVSNLAKVRWLNRNFVQNMISKDPKRASWLGLYNSTPSLLSESAFHSGLWWIHSELWFDDYAGDNGSPSFRDLALEGKGLNGTPPSVGSLRGIFFTDFAVRSPGKDSLTPAQIILGNQPRGAIAAKVVIENDDLDRENARLDRKEEIKEGQIIEFTVAENIANTDAKDFLIAINGLSPGFDQNDFIISGGKLLEGAQLMPDAVLPGFLSSAILIDPGKDARVRLDFLANDRLEEQFSLQLIERTSGDMYGASTIYTVI